ncbi:MAG: hypothetical protein A2452_05550 [Candidatus Firestonebacteria bacterium RIFOXYC2_FULL_39_67]|nr:MAG: hypothetical protein A2536_10380 [Candidatus Firestonebacteria bacterium RIFOXYD2_FULL_39_29]OGF56404.1 MAG: hypothetical protein A2452_05550 [Candidatus Firestonebacteria bacterium RIFOXYC2_FULL_39_67]
MKMSLNRLSKPAVISILIFFTGFACSKSANTGSVAEPVTARATISKDKINIGDKVDFRLLIEAKGDIKQSPVDLSLYLQAFEIKDHIQKGPEKRWGKTVTEYRLVLTTFTTGNYEIPEISVKYTDKDSLEKEVKSNKIILVVEPVKSNPNDKDDIRDVKKPLTIPHSFWFWLFTVILPLIAIAAFFLVKYLKSGNVSKIMEKAEPARPPHETAYERLSKLKELKLVEEGKIREHYYILSEIIRGYLEARYELPVVERTTSEAYKEMLDSGKIKRKEVTIVKDFLEECDLVKFAKVIPESTKIEEDYGMGISIVDMTKVIPVIPELSTGGGAKV